jgi:hypothetical protein
VVCGKPSKFAKDRQPSGVVVDVLPSRMSRVRKIMRPAPTPAPAAARASAKRIDQPTAHQHCMNSPVHGSYSSMQATIYFTPSFTELH